MIRDSVEMRIWFRETASLQQRIRVESHDTALPADNRNSNMALALTRFTTLLLLVPATHAWAPVVTPSNPIGTPWTKDVSPAQSALYPRPQLVRPPWSWQSLNGLWQIDYEVGHTLVAYISHCHSHRTRGRHGLYV